jgi:hypothetical protein
MYQLKKCSNLSRGENLKKLLLSFNNSIDIHFILPAPSATGAENEK